MRSRMLIVIFALVFMVLVPSSVGQSALVALPANLQGELDGVPYVIRVPANWNGTLLVYTYGYAEAFPQLPLAHLPGEEDTLLGMGFALAATRAAGAVPIAGLPTPAGWNVKERMQNTLALTAAFREMVGKPQRTIMWGTSLGGLVTLGMIEKFPGLYDGAVALCPPAAGATRVVDQRLDITLAYAVALGWNPAWGTPGKLRSDLNFMAEVYPHVMQQLTPGKKGAWEFIRLVNHMPIDSYYVFPGGLPFRLQAVFMAFVARMDLESRAGGIIGGNIGRGYTLSETEKTYLAGLGVDADALLDQMNDEANKFAFDRNARNYAAHYLNPSGHITRPVITLQTTGDSLVIPNHEAAYLASVEQQGNGDLLLQKFTNGIAHCTFTPAQEIAAINAMMSWLDTGNRPGTSFFTAPGFVDFVPDAWPW